MEISDLYMLMEQKQKHDITPYGNILFKLCRIHFKPLMNINKL